MRTTRSACRAAQGCVAVLSWTLAGVVLAQATSSDPTQRVEIVAKAPGAREEKTLAQLRAAQQAFERHHALAPEAGLAFRLYARLDPADLSRLRLFYVTDTERRPVPLDDHQRFTLDPAWTDAGALLQTNLPDGAVAWKIDVRTPGIGDDERRLGDLRLECEADMFHGNLQRGIRSPAAALMSAQDDLCRLDDAEIWFAERPIFGVVLRSAERRLRLPYRYVHCSDGTMALARLFDWPYALRDRAFFLPLEDASWPDEARVAFDYMDDPQPGTAAAPP
jgi:hypothetical protein